MRRFDRLQLVESQPWSVKYLIESIRQRQSFVKNLPPPSRLEVLDEQILYVENGFDVLLLTHLELQHPFNPVDVVRAGVDATILWVRSWAHHESRRELPWIDAVATGMLLALCIGDEGAIQSLASFSETDLCMDELDYKPADAFYHMVLARLIRGAELDGCRSLVDEIERGRSRRAKLLLKAVIPLFAGESRAFHKSLLAYMEYFQKREFDRTVFVRCTSVEGAILWNLAATRGLELEPLDLQLMDLIITPASLRLAGSSGEDHAPPLQTASTSLCEIAVAQEPHDEARRPEENSSEGSLSEQFIARDERRAKRLLQAARDAAEEGDVARAKELLVEATALTALWGTLAADAIEQHGMLSEAGELKRLIRDLKTTNKGDVRREGKGETRT